MFERTVIVEPDGGLRFVYADELVELVEAGDATVKRASVIVPAPEGRWMADVFGGPMLGPFRTRAEAERHEVQWIEGNALESKR